MGSRTKINEFALFVETDYGIFRKILDKLYFVVLAFFFQKLDCFGAGFGECFQFQIFFDNFLHLGFEFVEIFGNESSFFVKVVVESVVDGRPYG